MQHGLGGRDDDHDVRVEECRVDAERDRPGPGQLDQVVALDVVHLHVAVEAPRKLR